MKDTGFAQKAISAVVVLYFVLLFGGCTNSDRARNQLRRESEDNYGTMRTVTAYSQTGKELGSWHGKIDVQYAYDGSDGKVNGRVDLVVFDGETPVDRIVISNAIVVVDND